MSDAPGRDPTEGGANPPPPLPDPPARRHGLTLERCYRHPETPTGVHCTRCGRPICVECMQPASLGYQCPDCAGRARRGRTYLQPGIAVGGPAVITRLLLAANILWFFVELSVAGPASFFNGPSAVQALRLGAMNPLEVAQGQYWRLFSLMFVHFGILHIGFNMYALYLFGTLLENNLGRWRFLALYFVSGFLASAFSYAFLPLSSIAGGASGAIFGLFGAWIAYNFRRRHSPVGAAQLRLALFWLGLNAVIDFTFANIDWRAHLGGLLAGAVLGWMADGLGLGSRRIQPLLEVLVGTAIVVVAVVLVVYRSVELAPAAAMLSQLGL